MQEKGWVQALGPGLLFAAAAVGVSHLVQSTRAGALFGLGMFGVMLLANLTKYPAFRFGQQYAAATGTSLLEGYRRQGTWALWLYALLTLLTMFTVQAAVTFVTAALLVATLKLKLNLIVVSAGLMALCAALLGIGHYRWLDRVTKLLVGVLTLTTLISTALVLPRVSWGSLVDVGAPFAAGKQSVLFVAAFMGWMPSAIDVAVWQSLWVLARRDDTGHVPTVRESMIDFHIGYIGTVILAACFMLMGAGVMFHTGRTFEESAPGFANQVISLYTETLGSWVAPVVGIAAFAVMFSTTLTVVDGFPRAISVLVARLRGPEEAGHDEQEERPQRISYWAAMAVLFVGSSLVISVFLKNLKTMVDVATTLSCLTAPLLAVLNHRAVNGAEVPEEGRPKPWLQGLSLLSIAFLFAFAIGYLVLRYG
ncbi:MAG: Nramp family divalent metal transporter [Polyangiaceae bacterium]